MGLAQKPPNCRTVTAIVCINPGNDGSIFQNRSKCPIGGLSCTPLSWSWTAELSPPPFAEPHVVIVLSPWHHKAKALSVAAICGWSTRAVRHSLSSIPASSKVVSGSTRTRFFAVTSLRYFFPTLPLGLEPWKEAEVSEVQHARLAKLHLHETSGTSADLDDSKNVSNESLLQTSSPSQARLHDRAPSLDSPT